MGNCISKKTHKTETLSNKNTSRKSENKTRSQTKEPTSPDKETTQNNQLSKSATQPLNRPVNKVIAVRSSTIKFDDLSDTPDAVKAIIVDKIKSSADIQVIKSALKGHFLFNDLTKESTNKLISQMKYYTLTSPGETIFKQGDEGKSFFIVSSGKLEILVDGVQKGILTKGMGFGELALIHKSKRTATIKNIDRAAFWGINRESFRSILDEINRSHYDKNSKAIEKIDIFKGLRSEQRHLIAQSLVSLEFNDGDVIIYEGDNADCFYIIEEGTVHYTKPGLASKEMTKGQHFGEIALFYNQKRSATITADGKVKLLSLSKTDLNKVLGDDLDKIILHNALKVSWTNNTSFSTLPIKKIESLIDKATLKSYIDGETAISPTDFIGSGLWIVLKGKLKSLIDGKEIDIFKCVGDEELSNPLGGRRKDTYTAVDNTVVAYYDRKKLEEVMGGDLNTVNQKSFICNALRRVQILNKLSESKILQISEVLEEEKFEANSLIFEEGETGKKLYLIKSGQVAIMKGGSIIRTLKVNDYFGERAIITKDKRTANAKATEPTTCWVLENSHFLAIIDDKMRKILRNRLELQNDNIELNDLCIVNQISSDLGCVYYLVIYKKTKALYVLKTISRESAENNKLFRYIKAEKGILLQLDHPMIVKMVKTYKDPKRMYFLMEYIEGVTLEDILTDSARLPVATVKFYISCLLLVIECLHNKQILYRNFKPENVKIDKYGYPRLINFGIAKIIKDRTYTMTGTPHYMAPEVVAGKGYHFSADIWSLGIIMYEMLYGMLPFGNDLEDPMEIYEQITSITPKFPKSKGISNRVVEFMTGLLNKQHSLRGNTEILKKSPWFAGQDWEEILDEQREAPYKPTVTKETQNIKAALEVKKSIFDVILNDELNMIEEKNWRRKPTNTEWDSLF